MTRSICVASAWFSKAPEVQAWRESLQPDVGSDLPGGLAFAGIERFTLGQAAAVCEVLGAPL